MINGVPTSTAALLGEAERGRTEPRLVTSIAEYRKHFGNLLPGERYLADAVDGFFLNGGRRVFICRVVAPDAETATCNALPLAAVGPGAWGNRIVVQPSAGDQDGRFDVNIAYFDALPDDPDVKPFDDPALLATATIAETFQNLEVVDSTSPNHWTRRLKESSVVRPVDGHFTSPPTEVQTVRLSGGSEGRMVVPADYEGEVSAGARTGLAALDLSDYDEVSLIAAPGMSDPGLVTKVCNHCEQKHFRFAVLDGPSDTSNIAQLDPRSLWDTSYAGYYVPWLQVPGPLGQARLVPPSGHVLGIFVRTDTERGIWKAAANERVRGAIGLEASITPAQQEVLNPRGVNAIREFPGRGIRVWGARTLSSDPELKYVPVRRFLSWVERSLYEGTQWVVFEPQSEQLWARVRTEITSFLITQWKAGALLGIKPEEGFFVRCDRSTMTANDVQSGRLICEVGLAVSRPAEFVILRLIHQMAE